MFLPEIPIFNFFDISINSESFGIEIENSICVCMYEPIFDLLSTFFEKVYTSKLDK